MDVSAFETVGTGWQVAGFSGDVQVTEWAAIIESPDRPLQSELLRPRPGVEIAGLPAQQFGDVWLRRPNGTTVRMPGHPGMPVPFIDGEVRLSFNGNRLVHNTF